MVCQLKRTLDQLSDVGLSDQGGYLREQHLWGRGRLSNRPLAFTKAS